jgi:hypothetical protein
MNPIEQLNAYLNRLEARLRLKLLSRGSALAAVVALAATVALVLIANALAFSPGSVAAARVALFLSIALALAFAILIPLLRQNRFRAARAAEEKLPELEQRLLTLAERSERRDDPFLELLASDTLTTCKQAAPESLVSRGRVAAFASTAAAAAGVLIWLIMAGPGFMGHGASLLWAGPSKAGASPYYDVVVTPGSRTVRRKADQLIAARLVGFEAPVVRLLARYRGASKWDEIPMQPQPEGGGYEFLFASVADTLDYYVRAGAVRSPTFTLNVKDLPAVTKLRVTYHYPQWTGLADRVEDPGGDLRAVAGSEAEIAVQTDRPLANGVLELDTGEQIPLRNGVARVPIAKDGAYHIAALDNKEAIRLTEDYFIAAANDTAPSVRIERPGRDAKVSPIEEVTIAARADDDFGLQELALHYSVNGGAEKTLPLLSSKGSLDAAASTTLALEDFKLQPGDIVSFYAAARDARQAARTDMYFLQAEPFERAYSQSQQEGGGGGGGQEQDNRISDRQKEIIAATWNELRDKRDRGTAAENARFLSGVQSTLRDQARSLARRMNSRELSGANDEFKNFSKYMEQAAAAMDTASGKLRSSDWQAALAPEQQALQNLLRAEALYRDIQVAFGNRGGGGGGRGGMGRDLENLFDLELDTEKNQYETGRQSAASERDREMDETFQKLEQLARRQQELASRQQQQQSFQQRWQQEVLRREAEQLQRRIEQLARGSQGDSQSGTQGDQRVQQALDELRRATQDMQRASSQGGAEARRAAERINSARRMLEGAAQQQSAGQMDEMSRQAEQLAERQKEFEDRLRQTFSKTLGTDERTSKSLADQQDRMRADLERLEQQMRDAARNMAGTEPAASAKVRDALGDVEQKEARLRMQYNGNMIRRGLGAYTVMRQAPVTRALEELRDQMRDARDAVGREPSQERAGQAERALAQVEQLRRELEAAQGRERGNQGRQQGQGQQQGQDRQQGQGGGRQPGDSSGYGSREGDRQQFYGASGWVTGLQRLRRALEDYPELARKIDRVGPGNALAQLEQIELELRRKIDGDAPGQVRSGPGEPVPPGYAEAVADYFRRLSKAR